MTRLEALKNRVNILEDQLDRQRVEIEVCQGRVDSTTGRDYQKATEDLALARMKAGVMTDTLKKSEDDLKAEEKRMMSSDHQEAVKKAEDLKKSIDKVSKTIDKTYDDLRSCLAEFKTLCDAYDQIVHSRGLVSTNTFIMSSYRWSSYLHKKVVRMKKRLN